jgi:hypothetical protein
MALYRERLTLVAVKIEATSGTDATPSPTTDSVKMVGQPTIVVDYLESGDRGDVVNGVLITEDRAAPAARFGRIENLNLEVKGGGSAGSTPEGDQCRRVEVVHHARSEYGDGHRLRVGRRKAVQAGGLHRAV